MSALWNLLKKDFHLMISGKFYLLAGISLLLFSLYINLVFVNVDTGAPVVAVWDPTGDHAPNGDVMYVQSSDELQGLVDDGEVDVGLDYSGGAPSVVVLDLGSQNNALLSAYALAVAEGESQPVEHTTDSTRALKNRRMMSNEVLFFQISTVGFLGLASVLYKEKSLGVLRLLGVLPVRPGLFILSKSISFLAADILFSAAMVLINVGPGLFWGVFSRALPHVVILSVMMGLLGFLFSLICKDFRQFTVAFAFILILMTAPVFMAGNVTVDWAWINNYPVYHLFMALKNAFFGVWTTSLPYYLLSAGFIALLGGLVRLMVGRELARG